MHLDKNDLPVKIDVPGATARQITGFGDATPYTSISGEFFTLAAGTDIAPLLEGLHDDACQAPHWGYMLAGEVLVTYTTLPDERCTEGEVFHWPPGHRVRVLRDADIILFSPETEHVAVIDHMLAKMAAAG